MSVIYTINALRHCLALSQYIALFYQSGNYLIINMLHSHNHPTHNSNRAFLIGAVINISYVIIEATFGFLSDSLSLLADAGHNFSDVLVLLLAWGANILASVKPTARHTYGYRRATILAALVSGVTLIITMVWIAIEAIQRLNTIVEADSLTIIVVASVGVVINFISAALFIQHKDDDLNVKGAFLHMLADGLVSVAVVIGGVVIYFTDWQLIDPLLSLLIILVIALSSWNLIKDSFNLSVDAVPNQIDIQAVNQYLLGLPEVEDVHDLHVWAMSTTQFALTAHIRRQSEYLDDELLHKAAHDLSEHYGIDHVTIQVENGQCHINCQSITPE